MNIQEISQVIIRGQEAIKFPLKNFNGWVSDANNNHVLDIRGWGHLQYHSDGDQAGADIQDAIGDWIVDTLNAEAKKLGVNI